MTATIMDGKKVSSQVKQELIGQMAVLTQEGMQPGLGVIVVGSDPASKVYVNNKKKACQELGINSAIYEFPAATAQAEVIEKIQQLNQDSAVQGVLVQLPLPGHIDVGQVIEAIDPKKDVDCFHPYNFGQMALGGGQFLPCTPAGVVELLKRHEIEIIGKNCVIVGRSNIVGKPLALLLLRQNATVTLAHSYTGELDKLCREADILIAAVGKPGIITRDFVKPGAVVIDVGINRTPFGKLVGDVDFEAVKEIAGYITPVPGGVGPMTIAMLMKNLLTAVGASIKEKR